MAGQAEGRHVRLRSLDALRGIAAMAVVIFHMTVGFDQDVYFPGEDPSLFDFSLGRYGVALFFVLSGFVILWSLRRVETVGQFAGGRFSRLYPPYWASLLFVSAYILIAGNFFVMPEEMQFDAVQFLANLTMVPQWFGQKAIDEAYWTLAVEMGFYLLVGFLFWVGLTKKERIVKTLVVLYVVSLLVGIANGLAGSGAANNFLYYFVAGMALFVYIDEPDKDKWIKLALVFGAPLVPLAQGTVTPAVISLGIVIVMFLAVTGRLGFLESRPLLWLGSISYPLYLVHAYPGYITMKLLLDAGVGRDLAIAAAILQAVVLAIIVHKTIEKPITRWLRVRWGLGRPKSQVAAG